MIGNAFLNLVISCVFTVLTGTYLSWSSNDKVLICLVFWMAFNIADIVRILYGKR